MANVIADNTTKDGLALLREGYKKGAAEAKAKKQAEDQAAAPQPKTVPDHMKDFVKMLNEMDLLVDG